MNRPTIKQYLLGSFFVLAIVGALLTLPSAQAAITEVVGGLHSPRGLAVDSVGHLLVAHAGDDQHLGSIIEILNPMEAEPGSRSLHRPRVQTLVSGLPVVGEEGE